MELRPGLEIDDKVIAAFVKRHHIHRLAAFGSILRPDFHEHSDVDLLVEFRTGHTPGLLRLSAMELELGNLLGREVDLRTYHDLSPYFRDQVRDSAKEIYAA